MITICELEKDMIDVSDEELRQLKGAAWANIAGAAVGGISAGASTAVTSPGNWGAIAGSTVSGAALGFLSPVSSIGSASNAALLGIAGGMISGTTSNLVDMFNGKK